MLVCRKVCGLLQQARDLPADAYLIAQFAEKLKDAKYRNPETWSILQRKLIHAGLVFTPTQDFLHHLATTRIPLSPDLQRNLEDLADNAVLGRLRLAEILKSYALAGGTDTFLAKFAKAFENDKRLCSDPRAIPSLYVSFWRVGTPALKRKVWDFLYSKNCPADVRFACYCYAAALGDSARMNLLSNFESLISTLHYSNFVRLGTMVLTAGNLARYKAPWLEAVPNAVKGMPLKEIGETLKVIREMNVPISETLASSVVSSLNTQPPEVGMSKKLLFVQELSLADKELAQYCVNSIRSELQNLKHTNPEEASHVQDQLDSMVQQGI